MKILWLCSWYPHEGNPYEGDFIQRHAKALGCYSPLTVMYVRQDGTTRSVEQTRVEDRQYGPVKERIIFFRFRRRGIGFWDKLVYNLSYYSAYKKFIRQYIVTEGKPDIVHVHVPMKAGMLARWLRKNWKIPYIISEHSSHYDGRSEDDFLDKPLRYQYQVKKIFEKAEIVTNVSVSVGDRLKELFAIRDLRIIRNTVDTSLFYFKPNSPKRFRFIHVSTLMPYQKNTGGMLRVFERLAKERNDFEITIVGPAPENFRNELAKLSSSDRIQLTGEVTYETVAKHMQDSQAFVLFSRYENFPCVVIEALCCGLPVIASDVGGIREAVNEGNGLLVNSEDEDQLYHAMNKMINHYSGFDRKQISEEAVQAYSYDTIGSRFYELYKELAAVKKINSARP